MVENVGDAEKARAAAWFEALQGEICAAFERLEDAGDPALPAGRFERKATRREAEGDGGGGVMAVMRGGRVFEKVGVNVWTVFGTLAPAAMSSARGAPPAGRLFRHVRDNAQRPARAALD
ncbi:coproporphyrinogen III oxidase, partial [Amaricoccus sp.]|uniref:coproporphyrinogen III oxidase n=1 Tax=Amaricoccus sp. TaxID=1872485 RepID=UPI001B5314EB